MVAIIVFCASFIMFSSAIFRLFEFCVFLVIFLGSRRYGGAALGEAHAAHDRNNIDHCRRSSEMNACAFDVKKKPVPASLPKKKIYTNTISYA